MFDPETGVAACSWAVGSAAGHSDVWAWEVADLTGNAGAVTTLMAVDGAKHGNVVFVSARCENGAGIVAEFVSPPAVFILTPLTVGGGASIEFATPPSHRAGHLLPPISGFQDVTSEIHFRWHSFFATQAMLQKFECRLEGPNVQTPSWSDVGFQSEFSYSDLALADGQEYTVHVRASDNAGGVTAAVSSSLWIDTSPPASNFARGLFEPCATMDVVGLTVGWPNLFLETVCPPGAAVACLRYRFNIGEIPGEGNVVRWRETSATTVTVVADELPFWLVPTSDGFLDVAVTVEAVNLAGLVTTESFSVLGKSKCA